VTITIEISHI